LSYYDHRRVEAPQGYIGGAVLSQITASPDGTVTLRDLDSGGIAFRGIDPHLFAPVD